MAKTPQNQWLLLHDPATTSAIIGAMKRSFSRSPIVRSFLDKHRIEKPYIKKDGTTSSVPRVYYKCFVCDNEFPSSQIQVDHVEPVVPVEIPTRHMCLDSLVNRLYCGEEGLQILCKKDHKEKSVIENEARNEWLAKTKYIIYSTTNRLNNKKYIGIHKCDDYDDFYLGSGSYFKRALEKYGQTNFYRNILYVFDNPEEAFKKEEELVNVDIVESDKYYNLAIGGKRGGFVKNTGRIPIVCHQTKEEYSSMSELAEFLGVNISTVVTSVDRSDKPINNLHYFRKETYNPATKVTFPTYGKPVVCLNNNTVYSSLVEASSSLNLSYRSLRNSITDTDKYGLHSLLDFKFLYLDEYEHGKKYYYDKQVIRCVELDKTFDNAIEAAKCLALKNKKESMVALGINKAIRLKHKMYKYNWEKLTVRVEFEPLKI